MSKIQISLPEHKLIVSTSDGEYTDGPRTGEGTAHELVLAGKVALAVATTYQGRPDDFFVAGHEHEEQPKGSVSVAWESYVYGWAIEWPETAEAKACAAENHVWFEAINSCILAVHPR
jgi:hypothetical protein